MRWLLYGLLVLVVLVVLFTLVFPRVERMLDEPTLGASGGAPAATDRA